MQILLRGLVWFGFVFSYYSEAASPQNKYNLCALQGYLHQHTELAVFMYTEF